MQFAKTWDISISSIRQRLVELYKGFNSFDGKYAKTAMRAFLRTHGVEHVSALPPAQRTHFLIFVEQLKSTMDKISH